MAPVDPLVSFTLAHPLGTKDAENVGLEPRVYPVGSEVRLRRSIAQRLASAGLVAGAEPADPASVNAALTPVHEPGQADTSPAAAKPKTSGAAGS